MADLNMAPESFVPGRGGPLGSLARVQYKALAAMRTRLLVNRLRSNEGIFELGAQTFRYVIYGFMGLGLAAGAGFASYALAAHGYWAAMPVVLWAMCVVWQAVAVALASFQDQFDLSTLLRFPMGFGSYYLLCVLFSTLDIASILGMLGSLGILVGVSSARPDLLGWSLACIAVFAAFNVLLTRALLAWLDRWLAKRRSREILSAVFLLTVVALQLVNPALHSNNAGEAVGRNLYAITHGGGSASLRSTAALIDQVQAWLPPGEAAGVLEYAGPRRHAEPGTALGALGALGLYVMAAGGVLALRLRAEFHGENLGEAPKRATAGQRASLHTLLPGTGPITAMMEKDLRTLMRSIPQLYALFVPLLMVYLIANLFRHGAPHALQYMLPVCMAYTLLGFAQLMYNNLGAEGPGIQMLFLAPAPVRRVLLAKNLLHALLFVAVGISGAVLSSLRLGIPSLPVAAVTVCWLLFALPANLAAGNVLSITMAYRVNLGRLGRQSGSQANALLSMLIQMTVLGLGVGIIALCSLFDRLWLGVPILLGCAVVAVAVWWQILRNSDQMANSRREELLARLVRTE
ncbi:MAG TPA: hypothetical protein VG893_16625 [Terracidiphilus sp.]|nr:hypothetical protein [Terracidiphilus sp.]